MFSGLLRNAVLVSVVIVVVLVLALSISDWIRDEREGLIIPQSDPDRHWRRGVEWVEVWRAVVEFRQDEIHEGIEDGLAPFLEQLGRLDQRTAESVERQLRHVAEDAAAAGVANEISAAAPRMELPEIASRIRQGLHPFADEDPRSIDIQQVAARTTAEAAHSVFVTRRDTTEMLRESGYFDKQLKEHEAMRSRQE